MLYTKTSNSVILVNPGPCFNKIVRPTRSEGFGNVVGRKDGKLRFNIFSYPSTFLRFSVLRKTFGSQIFPTATHENDASVLSSAIIWGYPRGYPQRLLEFLKLFLCCFTTQYKLLIISASCTMVDFLLMIFK